MFTKLKKKISNILFFFYFKFYQKKNSIYKYKYKNKIYYTDFYSYQREKYNFFFNHEKTLKKIVSFFKMNCEFIFIDIGSNKGLFVWLINDILKFRFYYIFEPDLVNLTILKKNTKKICNKKIHSFAVGDQNKSLSLSIPSFNLHYSLSGNRGLLSLLGETTNFSNSVKVRRLDGLFGISKLRFKKIFIKLDIEGFETYVLKGAINLIRQNHVIIMMEVNSIYFKKFKLYFELIKFLKKFKFEIYMLKNDKFYLTSLIEIRKKIISVENTVFDIYLKKI